MRPSPVVLALALAAALAMAPGAHAQSAPPRQTSADDYTRYELQAPGSAKFRILYEVTATAAGATHYCKSVRSGSTVSDVAVHDRMTGRPLPFEIVRGPATHACGIRPSDPEHDYISVRLPRPIGPDGEIRLMIDKTYGDSASYSVQGDRLVFERALGIDRNAVVLPAGWELVSMNHPSQVMTTADGRVMVSFWNIGAAAVPYRIVARRLP